MRIRVLSALAVIVAVVGCGDSKLPDGSVGEPSLRGGNSDFAFAFYGKIRGEPGNIALCPLSISRCMALIYLGSRGQTGGLR